MYIYTYLYIHIMGLRKQLITSGHRLVGVAWTSSGLHAPSQSSFHIALGNDPLSSWIFPASMCSSGGLPAGQCTMAIALGPELHHWASAVHWTLPGSPDPGVPGFQDLKLWGEGAEAGDATLQIMGLGRWETGPSGAPEDPWNRRSFNGPKWRPSPGGPGFRWGAGLCPNWRNCGKGWRSWCSWRVPFLRWSDVMDECPYMIYICNVAI